MTTSKNRFAAIVSAARGAPAQLDDQAPPVEAPPAETPPAGQLDDQAPPVEAPAAGANSTHRRGRPVGGKRSDPAYIQTTLLIPRTLHNQVKKEIIGDSSIGDFSDLVVSLLQPWLRTRRKG